MKKKILFTSFFIIMMLIIPAIFIGIIRKNMTLETITITNNDDLQLISSSGDGSVNNPFIIDNHILGGKSRIVNDYYILLEISGISKHVIITNNKFIGGFTGIYIENVNLGSIIIHDNYFESKRSCYNRICSSSYYGIRIMNSSNILIENNIFDDSDYKGYLYGIFFAGSNYIKIKNNRISSFYSIYGFDSFHFTIDNNRYSESVDQYFEQCSYFNITNNFHDYLYRFIIKDSSFGYIFNNTLKGYNDSYGLILEDSQSFVIQNNSFSQAIIGIEIYRTLNTLITGNYFLENLFFALKLYFDSTNNYIYENYFDSNNEQGLTASQAFDSGYLNFWFNNITKIGNFWSNLGLNSSYSIAGSAGAVDIYPRNLL